MYIYKLINLRIETALYNRRVASGRISLQILGPKEKLPEQVNEMFPAPNDHISHKRGGTCRI